MSTLSKFRGGLLLLPLVLVLAGCASAGPGPAPPADVELSVGFFWHSLAPYGTWLIVEPWGWVWQPAGVAPGWRPYTFGRWIYTDAGWTWFSYWRWGWAPFHYGRWVFEPPHGWVWIPGDVWAPAWVAWRHGPGWVGWAPLPPRARWQGGVGLEWDPAELDGRGWSFVGDRDFVALRLERYLVSGAGRPDLLTATRDITRLELHANRIVERGLAVREIERATGTAVPRVHLRDLERAPGSSRPRLEGGSVRVYRPEVGRTPKGQARPRNPPPAR